MNTFRIYTGGERIMFTVHVGSASGEQSRHTSGRTRYSIDFRTIHIQDAAGKAVAPNIDSAPTGTSLRDFVRESDFAPVLGEVVKRYDTCNSLKGELVFRRPAEAAL